MFGFRVLKDKFQGYFTFDQGITFPLRVLFQVNTWRDKHQNNI
jgi:hypothetical protein